MMRALLPSSQSYCLHACSPWGRDSGPTINIAGCAEAGPAGSQRGHSLTHTRWLGAQACGFYIPRPGQRPVLGGACLRLAGPQHTPSTFATTASWRLAAVCTTPPSRAPSHPGRSTLSTWCVAPGGLPTPAWRDGPWEWAPVMSWLRDWVWASPRGTRDNVMCCPIMCWLRRLRRSGNYLRCGRLGRQRCNGSFAGATTTGAAEAATA